MYLSHGCSEINNSNIERNTSLLMNLHIRASQNDRHGPKPSRPSDSNTSASPTSPGSKKLQDYQQYLMMLGKAKQDETETERDMQTSRPPATRSHTEIQPQRPWAPAEGNQWKPYRVLDIGVRPGNLATQPYNQAPANHALNDYQKQLVLLEEQNQIRLEQARFANASQENPASKFGVAKGGPVAASSEGEPLSPSNEDGSRRASLRPRPRTRRSEG